MLLSRRRRACVYSRLTFPWAPAPGISATDKGAWHGTPHPDPGTACAGPREGGGGAEEARGAQGRAEVREANARRRADAFGRGHGGEDEGVGRPRVAPRCGEGPRPEVDGGARHLREQTGPWARREAARAAPRSLQEVRPPSGPGGSSSWPDPPGSARAASSGGWSPAIRKDSRS